MKIVSTLAVCVLSGVLSAQGGVLNHGQGLAGTNGVPVATATGSLQIGDPLEIVLTNALPNAVGSLIISDDAVFFPLLGGLLIPSPDLNIPITTDAAGNYDLATNELIVDDVLYVQFLIMDPVAPLGVAFSNGLELATTGTYKTPASEHVTASGGEFKLTIKLDSSVPSSAVVCRSRLVMTATGWKDELKYESFETISGATSQGGQVCLEKLLPVLPGDCFLVTGKATSTSNRVVDMLTLE